MKSAILRQLTGLVLLTLLAPWLPGFARNASAQDSTLRVWTSASGQQIEAAYQSYDGRFVILRLPDGRTLGIPPAKLSADDRQYLSTILPATARTAPSAAVTPPATPYARTAASSPTTAPVPFPPASGPLSALTPGQAVTVTIPLGEADIRDLEKDGDPATAARAAYYIPEGFDPAKPYAILLVSQTQNASSCDHLNSYLAAFPSAPGWIGIAADGDQGPRHDRHLYRWRTARAALQALYDAIPAARRWPIVAGGYSGGAKRSAYIAALLADEGYPLAGLLLGGCNEDRTPDAKQLYSPPSSAFKVPCFFMTAESDDLVPEAKARRVADSLKLNGFKPIKTATYPGDHMTIDKPTIADGLNWLKTVMRPVSKPAP